MNDFGIINCPCLNILWRMNNKEDDHLGHPLYYCSLVCVAGFNRSQAIINVNTANTKVLI